MEPQFAFVNADMKLTALLCLALFVVGAAMAPLGVPANVMWMVFALVFLAIIVTYYRYYS